MGDNEPNQPAGVFASLRRLCDLTLATAQTRIELVSVEFQEERERLIRVFILAAAVVFLGNMAVIMVTLTIAYLVGPSARGPLLITITVLYLAAAIRGYFLLRKELRTVIDIQLRPNRCQWEMQSDGVYIRTPAADAAPACQQALIDFADTRRTEASKVKKRRSKGFARRAAREERNGD